MTNFKIILLFLTSISISVHSQAQSTQLDNILVSAEQITRDLKNKKVDLTGNVQVTFQQQHLSSDKAVIDLVGKTVTAVGKVSLKTSTMTLEGDYMKMNYETNKGTVQNGYVESGHVSFSGSVIHKVGAQDFEITDGNFTACKTCPPAWSFSGKKIKATLGGYAQIYQPIFRLASLPVLWFPYLIIPLKSNRQTGLLFPTFDFSETGGSSFAQSWFWAIDPHRDLTITLKNYSKRGLKTLLSHRFYMDQKSYGEFSTAFLQDKVFPQSSRLTGLSGESSISRWFFKYHHLYELPNNFIQRANINLVSDLQYLIDFPEEIIGHGNPALENRISLTKNSENWHSNIEMAYYLNLLKTDAKANNDDAVHRFPEIKLSLTESRISDSNFFLEFNSSYTNFSRNNFSFDDIIFSPNNDIKKTFNSVRDGEFNFDGTTTQDQIRAGQRLDIEPKLSHPLNLNGYLDILPSISYKNTSYFFDIDGNNFANRNYLRTELSLRSKVSRVFSHKKDMELPVPFAVNNDISFSKPISPIQTITNTTKYKHEIIPDITFTNVPIFNEPDHPFFGTSSETSNFRSDQPVSDQDFFGDSGLQFDYFDRILDRRLLSLSFTNTITKKEGTTYNRIGRLTLSQNYDFIEAQKTTNARPWSDIKLLTDLRLKNFDTNTLISYFPYHKITNISSRARFVSDAGNSAQLLYTKRFIIDDTLVVNKESRTENIGLSAGFVSRFFNLFGILDYSLVTSKINSWYYQIDVKPPGECWGIIFRHQQIIGGEANFKFNFSFSFDGKNNIALNDTLY